MSNAPAAVVTESAYLTLHYRLLGADGTDIVTTFNGNPATLMLGQGQLAPFLEDLLIGLPEGTHKTFALMPAAGFGERIPDLIRAVSRATLHLPSGFLSVRCSDMLAGRRGPRLGRDEPDVHGDSPSGQDR